MENINSKNIMLNVFWLYHCEFCGILQKHYNSISHSCATIDKSACSYILVEFNFKIIYIKLKAIVFFLCLSLGARWKVLCCMQSFLNTKIVDYQGEVYSIITLHVYQF